MGLQEKDTTAVEHNLRHLFISISVLWLATRQTKITLIPYITTVAHT
jgi:hypothetical protein